MTKYIFKMSLVIQVMAFAVFIPSSNLAQAQTSNSAPEADNAVLEKRFDEFLEAYWPAIKQRDSSYLETVHPALPAELHDFFFDVTLDMMRHAEENDGVEPAIECQDFNVCKVIYPQPNDSWAAQRFILSEDKWRWLEQ